MNIDWFTTIAQIINFLVFVVLLKRFLYGPIINMMNQREAKIAASLEEAAKKSEEAGQEAESYRRKVQELAGQREELLARAREDADALRKELIKKAREEVVKTQARWYEAFHQQKESFLLGLRQRAGRQVYAIARLALKDLADADLNQAIVDDFIRRIQVMDPGEQNQIAGAIRKSGGVLLLRCAFEIAPEAFQKITQAIREHLFEGIEIRFEKAPELICGIEVKASGRRIAWNLDYYLEAMEEDFAGALEEEILAKTIQEKGAG